jgi:DNA mismatch endonuclease (patch repair protein)
MTDVFSKEKRSEVMSKIRGFGNKETEIALIKIFSRHKIVGWRRRQKVFGKPDFVFWKQRVAIFVDGCFWHQCPLHSSIPRQNQEFWQKKLQATTLRDKQVNTTLEQKGWIVIRIWEHELKDEEIVCALIRSALVSRDC